jgi:hypothetical protein
LCLHSAARGEKTGRPDGFRFLENVRVVILERVHVAYRITGNLPRSAKRLTTYYIQRDVVVDSVRSKRKMVHPNFKLDDPSLLLRTGWISNTEAKSQSGRSPFPVHDPATDEIWTHVEAMDEVDTDAAIAAAYAAFPAYSSITARQRARMILELDRLVRENKEDLAKIIVMESGKALVEARAEVDYAGKSNRPYGMK